MRKLLRNREAVSPVLSTILLILIVVIGMSVAFAYFISFAKDYQTGRGASVLELVSIEDVWFKADRSTIEIWLYNYGKIDVKMGTLYVDSQLVTFANFEISVGKHKDMAVQMQSGWKTNIVYHLKLVTERGSVFEGQYVSPSA